VLQQRSAHAERDIVGGEAGLLQALQNLLVSRKSNVGERD
jgi:hypothetical protein